MAVAGRLRAICPGGPTRNPTCLDSFGIVLELDSDGVVSASRVHAMNQVIRTVPILRNRLTYRGIDHVESIGSCEQSNRRNAGARRNIGVCPLHSGIHGHGLNCELEFHPVR